MHILHHRELRQFLSYTQHHYYLQQNGWHAVRTLIRFVIDGKDIRDCDII